MDSLSAHGLRGSYDPSRRGFQPMNANYGLMPELPGPARGRASKIAMGERALAAAGAWIAAERIEPAPASMHAAVAAAR